MFAPPLTIMISDEEALGLIVREGMIGLGIAASDEICFWPADEFHPPVDGGRGPWKLCKSGTVGGSGWRADRTWITRTRV